MEPQWLTPDERAAWVRLALVAERLPAILDSQLRRDSNLTHFEYFVLATLSEAPGDCMRMSDLASRTSATLPRLSHVVRKLEDRGLVRRAASAIDARVTEAHLSSTGRSAVEQAAPGHVAAVREYVIDALTPRQQRQLAAACGAMLTRIDPEGRMMPPQDAQRTG